MLTILFWNFPCADDGERPEAIAALARSVRHHQVDILVLAETKRRNAGAVLEALDTSEPSAFELAVDPAGHHPEILFFTRFPARQLRPLRADTRLDVRRLILPGRLEVLLAALHFYDRRNYTPEEQTTKASEVYITLQGAEIKRKHTRTVLFGDMNMHPFENGMINSAIGFASLPTRTLASLHSSDDFRKNQRFYNPTWTRLGREEPEPPGTYYYGTISKPSNLFWYHLDQVLIRPALFDSFRDEDFQILRSMPGPDGDTIDLIRSTGKHWELKYSDHLPILFKLDPPKEPDHA